MRPIEIRAERAYSVIFVRDWFKQLSELIPTRKYLVVAPEIFREQLEGLFEAERLIFTSDGESQKNLATLEEILETFVERGLDRNSLIVAIGGGATTDLVGFAAASFMRGIDWIAVPTTVAGMVDAAVGGKTGLNLRGGKNLVGAFHSPLTVIVDFAWLETLSARDRNAGLAESAKCGFIADPSILALIASGLEVNLEEIIYRSIAVKARVVSQDFRESYEREALNYGHTLGHAIERESGFQLRHGEAISIGLCFAAEISGMKSGLSSELVGKHYEILKLLKLPTTYSREAWPELANFLTADKKRKSELIRFVTVKDFGETTREELSLQECQEIYFSRLCR